MADVGLQAPVAPAFQAPQAPQAPQVPQTPTQQIQPQVQPIPTHATIKLVTF